MRRTATPTDGTSPTADTGVVDQSPPKSSTPARRASAPPRGRRWLWLVGAVLLIGGLIGAAVYFFTREGSEETQLVLQGNIDVRQVNLSFKVAGRIETLAVDEGDSVKAGQIVATLDKRYFHDDLKLARARRDAAAATLARLEHGSRPEEIAQAQALLEQQQAALHRAQHDFNRGQQLIGTGAITREEFDLLSDRLREGEARTRYAREALRLAEIGPRKEDIDAARAQLRAEDAAIIQAERRLEDSDLIAPSNGVILTRAREKGAIVKEGETVFTLTLETPVWVRTYVNELDLGRIHPGMPATVRTDSAPNKVYHGHIGFISPTAEFTPKTVETRELRTDLVYRLRVVVADPDNGLRQGMPVTVKFDLSGGQ